MPKEERYDHLQLIDLRIDLPDMRRDFNAVCRRALDIWGKDDGLDEPWASTIRYTLDLAKPYAHQKPTHANRVYLTTDCVLPLMVLADVDGSVLSAMKSTIGDAGYPIDRCWYREDAAALWIFEERKLTLASFIPTMIFGQLLIAFYRENLVCRERLRNYWYTQPIRDGLREKRLLAKDAEPPSSGN